MVKVGFLITLNVDFAQSVSENSSLLITVDAYILTSATALLWRRGRKEKRRERKKKEKKEEGEVTCDFVISVMSFHS